MELVKDDRKIERDGDKITYTVSQAQIINRKGLIKTIEAWKDGLRKTSEFLDNFDIEKTKRLEELKTKFDSEKKKYEDFLKLSSEEQAKLIEDIRKKDVENATNFIEKFNELYTGEVKRMCEFLENMKTKCTDDRKQLMETLALWDKKEYWEE
jgi:hypothetical protein